MTADVIDLHATTTQDIPAERVIEGALAEGLESVVVLGFHESGEFYFGANKADVAHVLFALKWAEHRIMEAVDDG